MQANLFSGPTGDLKALQDRLQAMGGRIRDARRLDPVSQFVRSFIASRTHDRDSWEAFWRLTRRFETWDALADAPVAEIEALLVGVTHPEKKAPELKEALRTIRARAGELNLNFLEGLSVQHALRWLETLHGVGRKIAAATLNFSTLRKPAFVVETHILRVLERFGFVRMGATTEQAYDAVMAAAEGFDADDFYELHWHLKRLGQRVCTQPHADCRRCVLSGLCLQRVEAARAA
ncbi:MAG: endonuclease [Alphaproteobacteria bacterium]|nr:endonuclease [Alphaproteobacteria bacterium]